MRVSTFAVRILSSLSSVFDVRSLAIERRITSANPSFGGANNYFLHGLANDTAKQQFIKSLSQQGAKVVRLWVQGTGRTFEKGSQVKNINELEPYALAEFDSTVLHAIDDILFSFSKVGLKAIISPHDAGKLSLSRTANGTNTTQAGNDGINGHDVYGDKWTTDEFYTNDEAIAAYDRRLTYILNYKSPNFGRKWANMSDVIAAFDIQNEPFLESTPLLDELDTKCWLCGRAQKIRELSGTTGPWVATGAVGGSCAHTNPQTSTSPTFFPYNFFPPALNCPAIDLITVHGFSNEWANETCTPPYLNCAAKDKYMLIEEFGIVADNSSNSSTTGNSSNSSNSSSFDTQSRIFNDAGIPWLYWQIVPGFPHDQGPNCHGRCCTDSSSSSSSNSTISSTNNETTSSISNGRDGFEMSMSDRSKGNIKTANAIARQKVAKMDWRKTPFWGHVWVSKCDICDVKRGKVDGVELSSQLLFWVHIFGR